jgi:hypothetical protein
MLLEQASHGLGRGWGCKLQTAATNTNFRVNPTLPPPSTVSPPKRHALWVIGPALTWCAFVVNHPRLNPCAVSNEIPCETAGIVALSVAVIQVARNVTAISEM